MTEKCTLPLVILNSDGKNITTLLTDLTAIAENLNEFNAQNVKNMVYKEKLRRSDKIN